MKEKISDLSRLYPNNLWKNFIELSTIPRLSGHERQVVDHIKATSASLGLEYSEDKIGNILVKKPAAKGLEKMQGVILQAHLDMVGEKKPEITHDFTKDKIIPYIDDETVRAEGTTLGADNGIGAAAILAILEAKNIEHGPIEALFTVSEEIGLKGASNLPANLLQGSILLNLDHEVEGEALIGSAGATRTLITINYYRDNNPKDCLGYEVKVSRLPGGHSGTDISSRRGNAIKALNRLLMAASEKYKIRIADFNGGAAGNVIPSEATAVISLPKQFEKEFMDFIGEFKKHIPQISGLDESWQNNVLISAEIIEEPKAVLDLESHEKLLGLIFLCPQGVISMDQKIPELVESSINLGVIKTLQNTIEIHTMQRSIDDFILDEISMTIENLGKFIAGTKVSHYASYYGWKPNLKSSIANLAKKIYQSKFGKPLKLSVVSAGIECSAFLTKYPDLDMTSFGPNIHNAHSVKECVDIKSVGHFWDFLLELLKNIPKNN